MDGRTKKWLPRNDELISKATKTDNDQINEMMWEFLQDT